jgi:hypothetical protein
LNPRSVLAIVLVLLAGLPGSAQDWDPVKSALGWASFDRDGSCAFHDPAARKLRVWTRETGVNDEVDLTRLDGIAEKWVLDPSGNAWIVTGLTLQRVDHDGKLGPSHTLPAEVADLAWDARSFILCYRTAEPYLERRDLKGGTVLWTYGTKPSKGGPAARVRHHVAVREDGTLLLNSGETFRLEVLDINRGVKIETLSFMMKGQPSPLLMVGDGDRGTLAWWMNTSIALMAVPASQLGPGEPRGLVLARLDVAHRDLTLVPTGADERTVLVGILDSTAVLRGPAGGLTFFPIP